MQTGPTRRRPRTRTGRKDRPMTDSRPAISRATDESATDAAQIAATRELLDEHILADAPDWIIRPLRAAADCKDRGERRKLIADGMGYRRIPNQWRRP